MWPPWFTIVWAAGYIQICRTFDFSTQAQPPPYWNHLQVKRCLLQGFINHFLWFPYSLSWSDVTYICTHTNKPNIYLVVTSPPHGWSMSGFANTKHSSLQGGFTLIAETILYILFFPGSFSYGVLANIGSPNAVGDNTWAYFALCVLFRNQAHNHQTPTNRCRHPQRNFNSKGSPIWMLYNSSFPSWLFWKEYAWNRETLKTHL